MILVHQTLEVMDLVNLYVKLLTVRGNISKTIAMADLFLASLDKLTKGRVCSIIKFLASQTIANDHKKVRDKDGCP